jgi:hypothetical protein
MLIIAGTTEEPKKPTYQERSGHFDFKTDPANGCIIGSDGCHYPSEANALFHCLETTCGCGQPEEQHTLIREALKHFNRTSGSWDSVEGMPGLVKLVASNPEAAAEFIAHVLAHESLLEYGGSVGGSWLTDRGRQYMNSDGLVDDCV